MITIELDRLHITIPEANASARHYEGYTSAELMGLGIRTRKLMDMCTGAHARIRQVQLYVVERELMRRGIVNTYSDRGREVSESVSAVLLGEPHDV